MGGNVAGWQKRWISASVEPQAHAVMMSGGDECRERSGDAVILVRRVAATQSFLSE